MRPADAGQHPAGHHRQVAHQQRRVPVGGEHLRPLPAAAFEPFGEVLEAPADPGRVYIEDALANGRAAARASLSFARAGAADSDAMSGPVIARLAERVEPHTCWLTGSVSGDGGGRAVDAVVALLVTDMGARLAGVFNVVVHPDHRRRGFAAAVLVEAARAAAERGATGLYMQVTADNAPAQALYRRLGLRRLYGYHYRSARGR